ncbi:hypothetical protein [Singulisphaera sp. PoT]|uniref:hypothetical protein n=1 Tax=Singulisphaera sp. PoT TaxID=3411797 RepID=UPI003BF4625B
MAKKKSSDDDATKADGGEDLTQVRIFLNPEELKRVKASADKRGLKLATFAKMATVKEAERVEQGRD